MPMTAKGEKKGRSVTEGPPEVIAVEEYLGRKTLILGDINAGKTDLTRIIIETLFRAGHVGITLMDIAPDRRHNVGGKLYLPEDIRVRLLSTAIDSPRLQGKSDDDIEELAAGNARRIETLLQHYLVKPDPILCINDVSLYLQSGSPDRLKEVIDSSPTVIINGYYGHGLGDSAFSRRERERIEELMAICDRVIRLA